MIQFLNKDEQGEDREEKYRLYRKGLARQLKQAQCGQGKQTDCYLNHQTIGAVGRITQLLEVVAKWTGQLEGFTGEQSQAQEVLGAAALPSKGGQAEGAGGQG